MARSECSPRLRRALASSQECPLCRVQGGQLPGVGMSRPLMPLSALLLALAVRKTSRGIGVGGTGWPFDQVEQETHAQADDNEQHDEAISTVLSEEDERRHESAAGHCPSGDFGAPPVHERNTDSPGTYVPAIPGL